MDRRTNIGVAVWSLARAVASVVWHLVLFYGLVCIVCIAQDGLLRR